MEKIALLFLTRKELNHPRVWQRLIEEAEGSFNLYIHSKEPMEDPFFKDFRIGTIVPTEYLYHGQAWQVLIREALKESQNVKFIYLSESCSPLYSLAEIYHYLMRNDYSYMRYSPPWWTPDSEREISEIPAPHRWGNAEWIILNRHHAQLIADDQEVLPLASKHMNSDHEGYPSSLFSIRGCLNEVVYRQTTYANFSCPKEPFPYHFRGVSEVEEEYIFQAKRGGSLFARKFTPEFPSEMLFAIASQRLLPSPKTIVPLQDEQQQKFSLLQAVEEMSLSNSCAILPMLLSGGVFEVGYEIGVGVGLHMERMLESVCFLQFYGIDPFDRKEYGGIPFSEEEENALFSYVRKRFETGGIDATLVRRSSIEFSTTVEDHSVDFLYFNAEQMSSSVLDHLVAWFPKLKNGGVAAGYQSRCFYPALEPEIEQFFADRNMVVHQEQVEPKLWWVQL